MGVDVGGTKTLLAVFDAHGKIIKTEKFPTPEKYNDFLALLESTVVAMSTGELQAICVALPGRIDRENGIGLRFGNLDWKNIPIQTDIERMFDCPVVLENDAKLAGLSEANLIKDEFKKVIYITISTGIGIALIINGIIDQNKSDSGGNSMIMEHKGKYVSWESFASGHAITERYGKKASEINDAAIWKVLAKDFAVGILDLIAIFQPEIVIIGGGVGTHFVKFEKPLKEFMKDYETPMMKLPPIVRAKHPEEAVIYGCYDLLKEHYAKAA